MKYLYSIEEIHKVFPTNGSHPVLVTCNDFQDWVCKYDGTSLNIFNELIASEFAEIWGINTPEIALVKIKRNIFQLNNKKNFNLYFF